MSHNYLDRWSSAPEIILCPKEFSKAVDIWAIGCMLAELIGRNPLFPGYSYLDQISRIISVLGTPSNEDLNFITNNLAKEFVLKLPKKPRQLFITLFPQANQLALDLLERMLVFNPNKRCSVEQCLEHAYFDNLRNPDDEQDYYKPFDWRFEDLELTKENLQSMIYDEALKFHPEND